MILFYIEVSVIVISLANRDLESTSTFETPICFNSTDQIKGAK